MKYTLLLVAALLLLIVFQGRILNPLSRQMFDGHDSTQAPRIQQFTLNLRSLNIPPRLAPDFSFKLGSPVFNFYAPFSYWLTSGINLLGFDVTSSIKLSYLLSLIVLFTGMYLFLGSFFDKISSLLGATLYASSPWVASEIFVRGNLGEIWFMSLLPIALYTLIKNSQSHSRFVFIATILLLSFILTTHNIFSLVFMLVAIGFILVLKKAIKRNLLALLVGLMLSSYFIFPSIVELPLTQAKTIAQNTHYADHFLCPSQIWTGVWGYGGSIPGCNDGMAFMIGKIPIVLGVIGIAIFLFITVFKKGLNENTLLVSFILLLATFSIFLTTFYSKFIWDIFRPLMSLFQFPWRFLSFGIFGMAFFSTYTFSSQKNLLFKSLAILIALFSIIYNAKFFTRTEVSIEKFNHEYLSAQFIKKNAAYKIPEYLSTNANYQKWLLLEPQGNGSQKIEPTLENSVVTALDNKQILIQGNKQFEKKAQTYSERFILNIQYFPYWKILINNSQVIPRQFDYLGRPIIFSNSGNKNIEIVYSQTPIERMGDIISLLSIVYLLALGISPTLWKNTQSILK